MYRSLGCLHRVIQGFAKKVTSAQRPKESKEAGGTKLGKEGSRQGKQDVQRPRGHPDAPSSTSSKSRSVGVLEDRNSTQLVYHCLSTRNIPHTPWALRMSLLVE